MAARSTFCHDASWLLARLDGVAAPPEDGHALAMPKRCGSA
eukprot:COSAG06_NODE_48500_length_331_cov_1.504310_1_plen_40_part_10